MLNTTFGVVALAVSLTLFAVLGIWGSRRSGGTDRDSYLTARGTQGSVGLGLSLFASALGAWILFAPPEVGTFGGFLGIAGYAVGQALAVAVFAWVGVAVRDRYPEASGVLDFVRDRYGSVQHTYTAAVSLMYMFVFLIAELAAIGGVLSLLAGIDPAIGVVAVAAVTLAYTAYGGLPASVYTDKWQAWLTLGLVGVAVVSIGATVEHPLGRAIDGGLSSFSRVGAETFVVLVIAIVAANLFHQGFWQRVWAGRTARSVKSGAILGGFLIAPVVFLMGVTGAVAAGLGELEVPALSLFSLLTPLAPVVLAAVLVLAVTLVASTTDTLQNALTSLVATGLGKNRLGLGAARVATILITIPAVVIAVRQPDVLRVFLIADLLAATIVFPVFLGLWRRATASAALAGSVAGLLGVVLLGWVVEGSLGRGILLLTLPEGPALAPFLVAPLASGAVTWLIGVVSPRTRVDSRNL